MTQAAVSYQVKLLEERIGTSLFHRIKRQVVLTETGKRIAPLISGAFDSIDDAFSIARTDNESVLTISCSNTFAQNWLAFRLGAFQMQRPGLAVRLHTDDHVVDFARDEVDVAIRNSAAPWPGLVSHFLMRVVIAPLASPEFLAQHPQIRTAADLMALPRLSSDDVWWGRWAERAGAVGVTEDTQPRTGLRLDSQLLEGNAAMAGHGIAILNLALWRNELRSGRLVQPLADFAFGRGMYWLVYPPHKRNAPKIKAFRAWIEEEMRADAIDDPHGIFTPPAPAPDPRD